MVISMKRVLSMFLAIVMVVSLFTISVVPATAEIAETPSTETNMGVGDVSEGYTPTGTAITTAEGFAGMEANGTYYLAKDITLTASYAGTFTGTFDGNGYTITLAGYAAFNNTQNATIKNLKLTGQVTNAVSNYMAAVTNSCTGGTFANIYTDADISSEASGVAAGGIFAVNYDGAIKVENCTNAGDIKVADIAAGIAAKPINDAAGKTAEFIGCINTGNITSTGSYAGGIIARGRQVNTVERCLNTGTITANGDQASGIVGYHWSNGLLLTIANCVNVGDIVNNKTNKFACGILGGSGATSKITVTNNLNIGALTGTYTYSQINYLSGATITSRGNYYLSGNAAASNSYTTGMITLSNDKLAGGEVTYKINSILGRNFFYQTIGTDAEPVYMDNTHGVVFYNDRLNTYANEAAVNPAIGDVASGYTPEAAAEAITTTEGFVGMNANGNYYLESDITLTEASPYFDGCFTGTFDGNGYTITLAGYAAFRSTTGATIKNLKLAGEVTSAVDATITNGSGASKTYSNYLGTVTQASGGGTFQNIVNNANVTNTSGINGGAGLIGLNDGVLNIINCINNGNIKVNGTAAGIISHPEIDTQTTLASVIGCTNNGRVESTASYAGGIIARGRWDNYVERCVNNGNITANSSQAAGIVAYHYGGWGAKLSDLTITKCMNTGDITCNVTGTKIAAGILGITDGAISNSYSPTVYNKLEITYNLNTGKLVGSSMRGIVNVHNGHVSTAFTCFGNYYIEGPTATNNTAVAADAFVSFNADELASGKVAYDLNKALGATPVFYQSISTNGDKAPVLDSTHGTVSLIDGKYTNGYITTVAEFAAMSATGSYILANDIDLSTLATPYYDGCFKGNFDGNGKTITLAGYSLFRSTSGATIKNLKLTGEVTGYANNYSDADPHESAKWNYGGDKFVAAVTAVTRGGTFENIFTDASITCTEAGVGAGGIFGVNDYGAVTVKNCTNAGNIDVVDIAAGIAARPQENDTTNVATFTECINTGNITSAVYAGGIIARGRHNNTVEKCLNAGKITSNCTGTNPAGGIVANYWSNNAKNTIKIEKCVNIGDVEVSTSGFSAGGILGNTTANVNSATPFTLIFNYNINIGTVSGTRARSLLNTNNGEVKYTAEGNYYLKAGSQLPTYNTTNSNGSGLMISFTADELASGEYTYKINTEILGKTVLYQAIGVDAAPSLDSTRGVVAHNADTNTYSNVGLLGSAITSAEEFAAMSANGLYYLANDIDLSTLGTKYYNGCFKGMLDGNGHTITLAGYPLFRSTHGATITNLKLSGSVTNAIVCTTAGGDPGDYNSSGDIYIAAVAPVTRGGIFDNITNAANISNTTGTVHAGAIYGVNHWDSVTVINCKNTGNVRVSGFAGGIVGRALTDNDTSSLATISGCVNSGSIESTASYAGGIVSRTRHKTLIEKCVNTGGVLAHKDQAAGIVAFHWGQGAALTITQCVNLGDITCDIGDANSVEMACGILGNAGGSSYADYALTFTYNINAGKLYGNLLRSLLNTNDSKLVYTSTGNYYRVGVEASNNSVTTAGMTAVISKKLSSGELAIELNDMIGETVFYQTLGVDKAPVADSTHGVVHNIKGNYTNSDHHFAGVNITLDSNIKVKYYVHDFEYSHSPQMRFTMNGKSVTVDGTLNAQTKYYEFVFEGVAPQCIGDNIKAELLVNGEVISEKDNYSVLTYLRALKAKSMETLGYGYDKYESMMTLVDNLLVYGGAAQGYINHNTNDLVSTNVPDKVTYTISGTDKSATNDSKVSWKSGSVVFDSVNKIVIRFTAADVAGLSFTVKINDGEATPIEYTPAGANTYAITTDAIYATGFNDVYTITASTGATVTYSVRSYVYSMKDDANVKDLVLATYSYGEAAKAFNGEKTTAQVISEIDKTTNQKISNIVNNVHDTLVPEKFTGTKYYVAANGNDSNNGTSESTPWKTLSKVNSANLGSGSAVFFRRGDTFRGNIVAQAGVTYAAYGEGAKPIIIANTITDANQTGSWSNYNGTSNIWVYHKTIADQGNIIFNDGIACGYKVTPSYKNSTAYVQWSENKTVFDVATGLDKDLSFVWIAESGFTSAGVPNTKTATGKLYLRCDAGNPAAVYSQSIEFAPNVFTIDAYANNVRVDNLCLKYTGAHAIGGGYDTDTNEALKDLIVTNCEIGWIGGSVLYYKDQSNETGIPVRYGNAVQAIGGVNNYLVQHNYIYHIYDAGITHQIGEGTNDVVMQKITYADNVILYCSYSVEYFLGEATGGATRYMANVVVRDNIMRYAGLGFGNQRPDKYNAAHIKGWGLHPNYLQSGSTFSIRNNVFDRSRYMMVHCGAANEGYLPTFENNVWIQYDSMTSVLGGYATNGNMNTEVAFTKANVAAIETGAECYIVTEDDQWFLPF